MQLSQGAEPFLLLIPSLHIHDVLERLAVQHGVGIVYRNIDNAAQGFREVELSGDMRGDDNILLAPERMLRRERRRDGCAGLQRTAALII